MEALILPCVKEKFWQDHPEAGFVAAKDAYVEPQFRRWRKTAEASGCPWFILSTKYGLLRPDDPIRNYNRGVGDALRDPALRNRLRQQGATLGLHDADRVVLIGAYDWFLDLVREAAGPAPAVWDRDWSPASGSGAVV